MITSPSSRTLAGLAGAAFLAMAACGCAATTAAAPTGTASSTANEPPPPPTDRAIVSRPADYLRVPQPWGDLTWYVSAQLGNSATMTVGQCVIKPGMENPRHHHPNCDEVLHVVSGTILHSMEGGKQVTMTAGDTVSIPAGVAHNAKNIGSVDAVLSICFSSAHRQVVGE